MAECQILARRELGTQIANLQPPGYGWFCCEGGKVIPQGLLNLEPPQYLQSLVYTFRSDSRELSRWPGRPCDPHLWLKPVGAKQVRREAVVWGEWGHLWGCSRDTWT